MCYRLSAGSQLPLRVLGMYTFVARRRRDSWVVDGPPGATGVLSGRGSRKRGSPVRSGNEVIHLIQGCHCALVQKLCKMPKSQTLNP